MAKVDKNIKKYCIICNNQLIIKSNRDITKKRFCYHKCHDINTIKERLKENPNLLLKCRMVHLLPKQKSKETKIELKIKHFLQKSNLKFNYQPLIKDIVNADFLIHPNIFIFADGDY